jgi:hypothetical protein
MRRSLLIGLTVAISTLSGVAAYQHVRPSGEAWREIAWPYPRDGWPAGRAFHCDAAACGDEVEVYVRPKIGFCNCDTGVADDDEVDRVADLDLISERFAPLKPGSAILVADMAGRLRPYDLKMSDGSNHAAVGIALSHRCDLLVAVAQGRGTAFGVQRAALDFLRSRDMARWIVAAMNGG